MMAIQPALYNAVLIEPAEPRTEEMRADPGLCLNTLEAPDIQTQLAHDEKRVGIHDLAKYLGEPPDL